MVGFPLQRKGKIRVYIIARISEEAHFWNMKIASALDPRFEVFLPQEHNPSNQRHETFSKGVFDTDMHAIRRSHIGLMLPEYGNDCAFEAGWYANSEKPLVVYLDTQLEWLRDWMVKGGVDFVVTTSKHSFECLKADPILGHRQIIHIEGLERLSDALAKIHGEHNAK